MTPKQALDHFGNQAAIAKAVGISQPSVFLWFKHGRIPDLAQLKIEHITRGELRADETIPRGWNAV